MNEAETRAELIDPALAALKQSLLHRALRGELSGGEAVNQLPEIMA